MRDWKGCPTARGLHSAALVVQKRTVEQQIEELGLAPDDAQTEDLAAKTTRKLYIFGGYGGTPESFGRYDFNDMRVLDLDSLEWTEVEARG